MTLAHPSQSTSRLPCATYSMLMEEAKYRLLGTDMRHCGV
jgi:hypothetical protein